MVQAPSTALGCIPITDDDETIAEALEDVSVPALMMSVVHMTGDASILRGPHRPAGIYLNEVQGFMSDEDQAAIRAEALEAIIAYRDSGCVLPPAPGPDLVHEMMNVLVAQEVPDEYVPLLLEELELDGTDRRDRDWGDLPPEARGDFHVLVIGAGMAGLLAGIRLRRAGIGVTTSTVTRSPRTTVGPNSSPANPSCSPTSNAASTNSTWPTRCGWRPRSCRPGGWRMSPGGRSGSDAPTGASRRSLPTR